MLRVAPIKGFEVRSPEKNFAHLFNFYLPTFNETFYGHLNIHNNVIESKELSKYMFTVPEFNVVVDKKKKQLKLFPHKHCVIPLGLLVNIPNNLVLLTYDIVSKNRHCHVICQPIDYTFEEMLKIKVINYDDENCLILTEQQLICQFMLLQTGSCDIEYLDYTKFQQQFKPKKV